MGTPRQRLALLLSGRPEQPGFRHGVGLAGAALDRGLDVGIYCLDDAVAGVSEPGLQALRARGALVYACAYAATRRDLPITDDAVFGGLGALHDLILYSDRFLSFR